MGRQVKKVSKLVKKEKKLVRDIHECMKCHYFWGNDNRCITSNCVKKEKPKKAEETECTNCPYKQNEGYCFPCMKKLLNKKEDKDVEH